MANTPKTPRELVDDAIASGDRQHMTDVHTHLHESERRQLAARDQAIRMGADEQAQRLTAQVYDTHEHRSRLWREMLATRKPGGSGGDVEVEGYERDGHPVHGYTRRRPNGKSISAHALYA